MCLIFLSGCSEENNKSSNGTGLQTEVTGGSLYDEGQDDDDHQVDYIDINENEKQEIGDRISDFGVLCRDIYISADKAAASNIVLEEETVHAMAEAAASRGWL